MPDGFPHRRECSPNPCVDGFDLPSLRVRVVFLTVRSAPLSNARMYNKFLERLPREKQSQSADEIPGLFENIVPRDSYSRLCQPVDSVVVLTHVRAIECDASRVRARPEISFQNGQDVRRKDRVVLGDQNGFRVWMKDEHISCGLDPVLEVAELTFRSIRQPPWRSVVIGPIGRERFGRPRFCKNANVAADR